VEAGMTFDKFDCGVNLGGWISQYQKFDKEHFDTFITGQDIEQIAGWGMDHVRLPVDYPVLEDDDQPFAYRPQGLRYIDDCLEWCQARGLGLVLDLHKAPGYSFTETLTNGDPRLNTLFAGGVEQERFLKLWEMFAKRYQDVREGLAFELLNEIVLPDSEPWNRLAGKALQVIRSVDAERTVIIGGNHYNSAEGLQSLAVVNDPNVVYTFHFYEPMLFTHQKAHWNTATLRYNQELDYPGPFTNLKGFIEKHSEFKPVYAHLVDRFMDRAMLEQYLQPALDFQLRTGKKLYCGEFGVIETTPMQSQVRWLEDFTSLLRQHHIGYAMWSYKQMDFGLVDGAGQVIDEKLLNVILA
jgi:endoglucanase